MKIRKKVYIIAEIGINHNRSLDNCYRLIDSAVSAGCDCVKFQFFKVAKLYPRSAGKLDWKDSMGKYSYNIYKAVESFELPGRWIRPLMKYCRTKNIDFLSSIFDKEGAHFLVDQGMNMIKISSYSITNLLFIECCAQYKLPIIISTGGATMGEVEEAVGTVNKYHNRLSLLHCSIKYPTPLNECNLGIIQTLKIAFPDNSIGYSDHSREVSRAAIQAVYLGAEIIEKHITLDRKMEGPDHFFALEPLELKKMVGAVRKAEKDLKQGEVKIDKRLFGSSKKRVFEHERYLRDFCFTTIFVDKDIKKGERIRYRDLCLLRPGKKQRGLEPKYIDLFRKYKIYAVKDITREEPLSWEKIFNA